MTTQIQTKRLGSGFTAEWQVYGEWQGKLPKYAQRAVREIRAENKEEVRVVTSKQPEFMKLERAA